MSFKRVNSEATRENDRDLQQTVKKHRQEEDGKSEKK